LFTLAVSNVRHLPPLRYGHGNHKYSFITYTWPSWPSSNGSWIYNYQCNKCLTSLM